MATIDATKHGIAHTVGGTALQRRNSLHAGGQLTVAAGHFVAVVLAKDLPPPDAAGNVAVTMRMFECLLLECFKLVPDFSDHQAWVAEVTAFSQMLADLDDGSAAQQRRQTTKTTIRRMPGRRSSPARTTRTCWPSWSYTPHRPLTA